MTIAEFKQELIDKRSYFISSRGRLLHTDTGPPGGILQRLTTIILMLTETVRSSTQDRLMKYRGQHITETQVVLQLLYAAAITPAQMT